MILSKQSTIKRYDEIVKKSTGSNAVQYQMENYLNGDKDIFPDDDLLYSCHGGATLSEREDKEVLGVYVGNFQE